MCVKGEVAKNCYCIIKFFIEFYTFENLIKEPDFCNKKSFLLTKCAPFTKSNFCCNNLSFFNLIQNKDHFKTQYTQKEVVSYLIILD